MRKQQKAKKGGSRDGDATIGNYEALLPQVLDDVERVPLHFRLRDRGGGDGRRMKIVKDLERIDRAAYSPEGKIIR